MKRSTIVKSLAIAVSTVGVLAAATAPANAYVGGPPTVTIQTLHDRLCIEVPGNSTADGTAVDLASCNNLANNQNWTFISEGTVGTRGSHLYEVVNYHSGKCLDLGDGGGPGDLVVQRTCNGGHSQMWWFLSDPTPGFIFEPDPIWNLVNYHTGLYLSDPHYVGGAVLTSGSASNLYSLTNQF
jgi:hypothetical protein